MLAKTERKTAAGRPRLSLDNIKIDLKETRWEEMHRIKSDSYGKVMGSCEYDNEPAGSIKHSEFRGQVVN